MLLLRLVVTLASLDTVKSVIIRIQRLDSFTIVVLNFRECSLLDPVQVSVQEVRLFPLTQLIEVLLVTERIYYMLQISQHLLILVAQDVELVLKLVHETLEVLDDRETQVTLLDNNLLVDAR